MTLTRPKLWAAALLAAVFAAGLVVGWAAQTWSEQETRSRRGRRTDAWVANLSRELNLTDAQRDSVRAVYERRRAATRALWQQVRPPFDSLRSAMQRHIAAQLDPERRARYLELLAEREQRKKRGTTDTGKHD
jgi:Spy/CpxP family protein refolding chaperone